MEIIRVREKIYQNFSSPSVALGNFDGVHLGHQEILRRTVETAHGKGREAVVYTFDPHPRLVLNTVPDVPRITTPRERADILEHLGIDVLILAEFTKEFAAQSAEDFVLNVLVEELGIRHLFIGENYRFGKARAGTPHTLKKMAPELGFVVHVVPPIKIDGDVVSSSRIRDHLMRGEIREANVLLGREFTIEGRGNSRAPSRQGIGVSDCKHKTGSEAASSRGSLRCLLQGRRKHARRRHEYRLQSNVQGSPSILRGSHPGF